jgi:predicted amidophosphoribosyltransferase
MLGSAEGDVVGYKPVKCERCKRPVRQGKRFCKACALEIAKSFGFDQYFTPEPEPDEDEDPVVAYEKANRIKTAAALAILAVIGVMALWALAIGAR